MSKSLPDACQKRLKLGLKQLNLELSPEVISTLLSYIVLLTKWNKTYNLTAVRESEEMVIRHLLDSLSILPYLHSNRILDVGAGAGIPGIIIAITKPEVSISLLDSNGKKTRFMQHVKTQLQLSNMEVIQSRAENYSPPILFDSIVSRAFTALDKMVIWCEQLLSPNGEFLAMKGSYPEPNQKQLPVGWVVKKVNELQVPFIDEQRHLVQVSRV